MSENDRYKVPKPDGKDTIHTLTRAGLGSIPYLGAAASELFGLIIVPSLEKRRVKWMEDIAEALKKLEKQNAISIENLSQNETFINATLHATQAALRTNQKAKLKALRNAVINSALPSAPDEDTQQIFLNLVDTFTQWHLKILKFLNNPAHGGIPLKIGYPYINLSVLPKAIEHNYPELEGRYDFYYIIIKDLSDRGLVNMSASDTTHEMATMEGIPSTQVTELGAKLLSFIESQIDDDEK
jgi:hypothetical protein